MEERSSATDSVTDVTDGWKMEPRRREGHEGRRKKEQGRRNKSKGFSN
ncbi:hypothetical protein [Microcoleus sp. K5-D4]